MSEQDNVNIRNLVPAGGRSLASIPCANPLVARGMAGIARLNQAATAKQIDLNLGRGIEVKLVCIEPGKFTMGSPRSEQDYIRKEFAVVEEDWAAREKQHEVEISKPFYMGVYTVTQAEFERIMGKNPSAFSIDGGFKEDVTGLDIARFPVENVSWEDAMEFCQKLSQKEGKTFDLPTEAEWEYACRAGCKGAFHDGNNLSSKQANFNGNKPYGVAEKGPNLKRTTKVGSYEPNAFGLYDMHGNIRQWCKDWYKEDFYGESPPRNPQGPETGEGRVLRGGSWYNYAWCCRSAYRYGVPPYSHVCDVGFRVVVRLPEDGP